jgi:hypothetical protein
MQKLKMHKKAGAVHQRRLLLLEYRRFLEFISGVSKGLLLVFH